MKKLALVLGGGATKGYAHVGVLQVLEEHGIKPDLIVGTSMGAIVGGIYASGKSSEQLVKMSKELSKKNFMDFNIIDAIFHSSLLKGQKLRRLLKKVLGDTTHLELEIPFVAIATDLMKGTLVQLDKGRVRDNIVASASIPSVYPAVKMGERILGDGGLVNNVPDDIARKLAKDYVVLSIDVIGEYAKQVESSKLKIISRTVNALTLMQTQITKFKGVDSDLRINISQPDVPQMSFTKVCAEKSIQHGVNSMKKNLAKLKKLLED